MDTWIYVFLSQLLPYHHVRPKERELLRLTVLQTFLKSGKVFTGDSTILTRPEVGVFYNDWKGALNGAELASRGKAFAYSQEVETPMGRRVWKDIQIGDTLFAPDGSITKVINIPFDEEHDVYKMTLQDGRSGYTTLEHLWKNINKNGGNWNKLYTTEEILKSKSPNRFAIEVSEGVEYRYKEISY